MAIGEKPQYAFDYPAFNEDFIPVWDQILAGGRLATQSLAWVVQNIFQVGVNQQDAKQVPPGAPGHGPLVGSLVEWVRSDGDLIKFFAAYHEKYGKDTGISQVTLGHKVFYIVTDPGLANQALSNSEAFPRGESLRVWRKFSPGGLAEGEDTKLRRRQAFHVLGKSKKLDYYLACMIGGATQWMERIGRYADENESFDLMREAKRVTLANTGASFFSNSTEASENPFGLDEANEVRANEVIDALQVVFAQLSKRMLSVQANFPGAWGDWSLGDSLYAWWNPDDEKAFSAAKAKLKEVLLPLFQSFMGENLQAGSHLAETFQTFGVNVEEPDYDQLLDDCLGFLQASFETASAGLGSTLMVLADNPELQEKLRTELQTAFPEDLPESPKELEACPFLNRVVDEGLRLFPPIPFLIRDIEDPEQLERFQVQKGGSLVISPLLSQRDGKEWGIDPESFDPMRPSLGKDGAKLMTFNWGAHTCPGQRFAQRELKLLIAWLLLNFKLELEDPEQQVGRSPQWSITLGHGAVPVRATRL